MSGSTWSWVGAGTAWAAAGDWTLTSGSGNSNSFPAAGDTALIGAGTPNPLTITGSELNSNTIDLSGGASIEFNNGSTLDGNSVINASAGTIGVSGVFTDLGNIEISGSTSSLTISLASGATLVSDGLTGLDIGINVGQPGSTNNGNLILTGGTLSNQEIHINDGTATVNTTFQTNDLISLTGGLLDMTEQGAASPNLAFVSSTVPSTVKFENPGSFIGGSISGFASGDTIDLANTTVGSLSYTPSSGYGTLQIEDASGATVFSAILSGGDTGSFTGTTTTITPSGTTVAGNFEVVQGSGGALIMEAPSGSSPSPTPTPTPSPAPSPTPTPTPTPMPTPTPTPTPSPTPPVLGFAATDMTTGQPLNTSNVHAYSGPVAGLQEEYIAITSDNLNVALSTDNWFIHTGGGTDAIAAHGGTNVLDGGSGSNFLTGGSGTDTFFVDGSGSSAPTWSTIVGFHAGDAATVWGVTPQDFALNWADNKGATGYTGLTLHAAAAGKPTISLTLAGFSSSDLNNGRLSVSFGTISGNSYMYIHANV